MAHFAFLCLHLFAILFGFLLLFVTIPLHIIYGIVASNGRRSRQQHEIAQAQGYDLTPAKEPMSLGKVTVVTVIEVFAVFSALVLLDMVGG